MTSWNLDKILIFYTGNIHPHITLKTLITPPLILITRAIPYHYWLSIECDFLSTKSVDNFVEKRTIYIESPYIMALSPYCNI